MTGPTRINDASEQQRVTSSPTSALIRSANKYFNAGPEWSNAYGSIQLIAETDPGLLRHIIKQAKRSHLDLTFWHQMISSSNLLVPRTTSPSYTAPERLQYFRDALVLIDETRVRMRRHRGNPDWEVMILMQLVSKWCWDAGIEHNLPNLNAVLYAAIITQKQITNEDGCNNQLIEYMAANIKFIASTLDDYDTPELSIAYLESFADATIISALRSGYL